MSEPAATHRSARLHHLSSRGESLSTFNMTRRHSLTLHWPLHRRKASQSQPSSPATFFTKEPQNGSPTSSATTSSTRAQPSAGPSKAEIRAMAQQAWKELKELIEDHWNWPPSAEQPEDPLQYFNVDQTQLYREREQTFTPPLQDELTLSTPFAYNSPEVMGNGHIDEENVSTETVSHLTATDRKRKRQQDEIAEMAWNENLRYFNKRRHAWTGAVDVFLPEEMEPSYNNIQNLLRKKKLSQLHYDRDGHVLRWPQAAGHYDHSHVVQAGRDSCYSPPRSRNGSTGSREATRRHSTQITSPSSDRQGKSSPPSQSQGDNNRPSTSPDRPRSASNFTTPPIHHNYALDQPGSIATRQEPANIDPALLTMSLTASLSISPTHTINPLLPPDSVTPPSITLNPLLSSQLASNNNSGLYLQTLLPPYKPLLSPDNPLRQQSQNPRNYHAIYKSLIEQCRPPHLPINLSDVVKTCVQGWKEDGTWPSPEAVVEAETPATPAPVANGVKKKSKGVVAEWRAHREWKKMQREKERRGSLGGMLGGPEGAIESRDRGDSEKRRKSFGNAVGLRGLLGKTRGLGLNGGGARFGRDMDGAYELDPHEAGDVGSEGEDMAEVMFDDTEGEENEHDHKRERLGG